MLLRLVLPAQRTLSDACQVARSAVVAGNFDNAHHSPRCFSIATAPSLWAGTRATADVHPHLVCMCCNTRRTCSQARMNALTLQTCLHLNAPALCQFPFFDASVIPPATLNAQWCCQLSPARQNMFHTQSSCCCMSHEPTAPQRTTRYTRRQTQAGTGRQADTHRCTPRQPHRTTGTLAATAAVTPRCNEKHTRPVKLGL